MPHADALKASQTLTVAELLARLPSFGLPHFQRGQVWDDHAMLAVTKMGGTSRATARPARRRSVADGSRYSNWKPAGGLLNHT